MYRFCQPHLWLPVVLLTHFFPADASAIVIPRSADPAHIEKQITPNTITMPGRVEIVLPPPKAEIPQKANTSAATFTLHKVVIDGVNIYRPDDLVSAYAGMLGKDISLTDAQTIAARITERYHNDGYVLSQAVVPPQEIEEGTLTIHVVEGYISHVKITGKRKEMPFRKILESYANAIEEARPLRLAELERRLLLINDLAGVSAKATMQPASMQTGAAELEVALVHKSFEGTYSLDNRGTKFVGPWQHITTFTANSLFGMYDRTTLRLATANPTSELRLIDLQHEEPLDCSGTKLVFDLSLNRTKPGDSLKILDILSRSYFFQMKLLHPFVRSRLENIMGQIMFDVRNTSTDVGGISFTDDRLRTVRASASYDFTDDFNGADLIDVQLSRGLNIFNASSSGVNRSNANGDSDFTKINIDFARTQFLGGHFSLFTAVSGQYALNPLLTAEQFTLGGVGFGQAYDPAELSGDHGIAGKIELRYGEEIGSTFINSYQLYGYYDIGRVWIRGGGAGANDKKSLASTGIGIRTGFSQHFSSSLEIAVPLTKPASNQGGHDKSPRIFFGITGYF
jgi:hemolysin activation/secretion protein